MSHVRLFELVYYLLAHGKTSAPTLAERFEVSTRTIYRDVEALSAAGIPVYTEPGRNGGIALMDHYVLDRSVFSLEEQGQLLTALRSLVHALGPGADEVLTKLSSLFRYPEADWLEVNLSRWGSRENSQLPFSVLREAILQRHVMTFTYAGSYRETSSRRVLPVKLVFKGQSWYLQAFCMEKQAYRTFKLTRMRELMVTEDTFVAPPAPPPVDSISADHCHTVRLVLHFSPALAFRVYDEFAFDTITPLTDGSFRVEVQFPDSNWVSGYLLSFGPLVEILEPPRIRVDVAALAKKIWERYENDDIRCQDSGAMLEPSHIKEESINE